VPYGPAYFHLGVHNLPRDEARALAKPLLDYTRRREAGRLGELLSTLDAIPEVLLVLNHPFWEMEPIGRPALLDMLHSFVRQHGSFIHALEISGLRPWPENQQALELAGDIGVAIVSGGDRHGWEANTMLNVTNAATFSEFVAEVREDGRSEVVVMPG